MLYFLNHFVYTTNRVSLILSLMTNVTYCLICSQDKDTNLTKPQWNLSSLPLSVFTETFWAYGKLHIICLLVHLWNEIYMQNLVNCIKISCLERTLDYHGLSNWYVKIPSSGKMKFHIFHETQLNTRAPVLLKSQPLQKKYRQEI